MSGAQDTAIFRRLHVDFPDPAMPPTVISRQHCAPRLPFSPAHAVYARLLCCLPIVYAPPALRAQTRRRVGFHMPQFIYGFTLLVRRARDHTALFFSAYAPRRYYTSAPFDVFAFSFLECHIRRHYRRLPILSSCRHRLLPSVAADRERASLPAIFRVASPPVQILCR